MTDDELAEYLGISKAKRRAEYMAEITPEKRAMYERMREVEFDLKLWAEGLGPKPEGVIVCNPRCDHGRGKSHKAGERHDT